MLLEVLVILGSLGVVLLQPERGWTDFQPMKSIRLELPASEQPTIWTVLSELDYEQAGALTTHLKKSLRGFQAKNSYILAKGSHVVSKHNVAGFTSNDFYEFPYGNSLALLSFSLGILLEGFRPAVIYQPMVGSLKGKDRNKPILRHQKEKSLFDLLASLPLLDSDQLVQDSELTLSSLNSYGQEALTFANTILGKNQNEAWLDSFYALGIEETPVTSSGQLKIRFHRLLSYSLAVIHELKILESTSQMTGLPTVDHHYLFGWWINCPRSQDSCLCPQLPRDLIISATPTLRIYVVPSLELTLIVHNSKINDGKSLRDILDADKSMWMEIHTFLGNIGGTSDQQERESTGESETTGETTGEEDSYVPNLNASDADEDKDSEDAVVRFIHQIWPVLVFVFWVVSSHVWVYWMLHCCWLMATYASERTHIPRPKSGSGN